MSFLEFEFYYFKTIYSLLHKRLKIIWRISNKNYHFGMLKNNILVCSKTDKNTHYKLAIMLKQCQYLFLSFFFSIFPQSPYIALATIFWWEVWYILMKSLLTAPTDWFWLFDGKMVIQDNFDQSSFQSDSWIFDLKWSKK